MDGEIRELHISPPPLIVKMGAAVLGALALFLLIHVASAIKQYQFIGSGVAASNTISVSGTGDVFAIPDTATFSVTVQEDAKDVKSAQDAATKKSNDIIAYLKGAGIAEKDIQTADYSVSPQYDYSREVCSSGYCPPGKPTLSGYRVSQTLTVKTKDTKKAGELLSGVGSRGAAQVSGLSFTIDNQDVLEAQARDKAIKDARSKAEALAKSLGVSLVRVVGFSENSGGYPIYFAKTMAMDAGERGGPEATPAPDIPAGQNKITGNVSIMYEIK